MSARRRRRSALLVSAVAAVIAISCGCRPARTNANPLDNAGSADGGVLPAAMIAPPASRESALPVDGRARDGGVAVVPVAPPPPAKVKIYVRAIPKATVSWGVKSLGVTPLTVERPRDSGPMDLVIRSKGYLSVHTRAYTFRNDSITVQMTKLEDAGNLLGAKKAPAPVAVTPGAPGQPIVGGTIVPVSAAPDGGAPR